MRDHSDLAIRVGVEDIAVDTLGRLVVELRLSEYAEMSDFVKVKKGDEFVLHFSYGTPTIEVQT